MTNNSFMDVLRQRPHPLFSSQPTLGSNKTEIDMDILRSFDHGIHAIDSGYGAPLIDAIHLIVENGRAALVDTAHNAAVPRVLESLNHLGIGKEDVDYVILTHVHLDHAGAAGTLMQEFPRARCVVHPRGARHMIDPSKLEAATRDVYGAEKADALYGKLVPVPAARVIEATHDLVITLNGRPLRFLDTPGHARHHVAIHDLSSGGVFTGDTFGISYRHLDGPDGRQFVFPTTTPSQFDPEAAHGTVDMIAALKPAAVYPTHYSRCTDVDRFAADLHRMLDAFTSIARDCRDLPARADGIRARCAEFFVNEAAEAGWGLQGEALTRFLGMDLDLNAQGLDDWLNRVG